VVAVLAYLVALGPAVATNSDAIAATAATAVLGPWAGKFVAAHYLISVFSATNSVVLTAPRVFYAMAKDNLFFKTLAEVHPRFHTPANASWRCGVWSAALSLRDGFQSWPRRGFIAGFFTDLGGSDFPLRAALGELTHRCPIAFRLSWTPIVFLLAAAAVVGNAIFWLLAIQRNFAMCWLD